MGITNPEMDFALARQFYEEQIGIPDTRDFETLQ